jgi:hypothetical protein
MALRAGALVRVAVLFVVVRDLTPCVWVEEGRLTILCCVDVVAPRALLTDWFSPRFCETVVVDVRLVAVRTFSELPASVVWDTDKPRHTAKNSIILFIPFNLMLANLYFAGQAYFSFD